MPKPAYSLTLPRERTTAVVFASPHSGRDYPPAFLRRSVLPPRLLRSSEDAFVDLLFGSAPRQGAPLLAALAPRAWVDLNRAADEMDPALIEGLVRGTPNPRVNSGLGVVPRVVASGRAIYSGKLKQAEADGRITDVWQPYHAALQYMLDDSRAVFGRAILVDCHSMPHEAIEAACGAHRDRPDVVLGDRFGAAADGEIVERIEAAFSGAGLKVARNAPFAGAYIVQHYGRPARGQHAVQIEIDRALYMNEARVEPNANFDAMRRLISGVISKICDIGRGDIAVAAE
jgi:N-formylglutamate amidohydrolase